MFRNIVESSIDRLQRDTPNYRLAKDYGLIKVEQKPVIFFF